MWRILKTQSINPVALYVAHTDFFITQMYIDYQCLFWNFIYCIPGITIGARNYNALVVQKIVPVYEMKAQKGEGVDYSSTRS